MAQPWMKEKEENAAVRSLMSGGQNVWIPTASAGGSIAAICWTVRRRAPSDRSQLKLCPSHIGIMLGAR